MRAASTNSTATWPSAMPADASASAGEPLDLGASAAPARPRPTTSTSSAHAALAVGRPQLGRLLAGRARRRPRRCAARGGGARRPRRRSARSRRPRRPQDVADHHAGRSCSSRGRSICVTSPVMTILEPKPSRVRNIFICSGRGVLRLVEDDEGVVQRAAAHEGQRRDLDDALLEVRRDLLGVEHVVERVEERPQVRVDLRHQVAGQEAEPLAGLDGRAREDDAVDLAARERLRRHRDGEERLARARRADAERHRVDAGSSRRSASG